MSPPSMASAPNRPKDWIGGKGAKVNKAIVVAKMRLVHKMGLTFWRNVRFSACSFVLPVPLSERK